MDARQGEECFLSNNRLGHLRPRHDRLPCANGIAKKRRPPSFIVEVAPLEVGIDGLVAAFS